MSLLTTKQAAQYLTERGKKTEESTLNSLRNLGGGPIFCKEDKAKVELSKEECDGLSGDVCWFKVDNLKKGDNKIPLNGYSIHLYGDDGIRAYNILKKKKDEWDKKMGLL
jgi:hypothetical protein